MGRQQFQIIYIYIFIELCIWLFIAFLVEIDQLPNLSHCLGSVCKYCMRLIIVFVALWALLIRACCLLSWRLSWFPLHTWRWKKKLVPSLCWQFKGGMLKSRVHLTLLLREAPTPYWSSFPRVTLSRPPESSLRPESSIPTSTRLATSVSIQFLLNGRRASL